jgi:DNA-binding MarR family transcriptional regulator
MQANLSKRKREPASGPGKASVERLVKELYGLGVVRREIARHALAELGTQGFNALAVVHVYGPMRISDASQKLSVDLSVASRQVNALVQAGYLEREPDPDDRRAHLVRTSESGTKVLGESHRRMVHAFQQALEGWTSDDVAAISDGLARLSAVFATSPADAEEAEESRR